MPALNCEEYDRTFHSDLNLFGHLDYIERYEQNVYDEPKFRASLSKEFADTYRLWTAKRFDHFSKDIAQEMTQYLLDGAGLFAEPADSIRRKLPAFLALGHNIRAKLQATKHRGPGCVGATEQDGSARFQAGSCPVCGKRVRVTSTLPTTRKLACTACDWRGEKTK